MSTPGWYPDPGGHRGAYRWWTGTAWTASTTTDPRVAPPGAVGPDADGGTSAPAGTAERGSRRRGRLIGVLALVVVVVLVVGIALVRSLMGPDPIADPGPTSTVSGWDDSSPLATATPSATPSPTPTPSAKNPTPTATSVDQAPMESCPLGDPEARGSHPNDSRVHGGGLAFSSPGADWTDAGGYADGLSWAYDVAGVSQSTEPTWAAILAVGALHTDDGFTNPKEAAAGVLQCVATSGYYHNVSARRDVWSRAVTVDGRPGWEVRAEIRVDQPQLSVPGDVVDVVVVDTGRTGSLAMFVGAVPIGDQRRIRLLTTAVAGLSTD